MQVAVYGGSFNPPHVGHAMVAAWLRWAGRADAVWLVPTHVHAFGKVLAPWEDRLAMCRVMAEGVGPWVRVCTLEAELAPPSYTIDTLRELARRHPEHRFRLVVGADVLPQTPDWRDWAGIEAGFAPVVVGRCGYPPVSGAPSFPEVSSTAIRDALSRGEPADHWLMEGVVRLAAGLYSSSERYVGMPRPTTP